MTKPVTKTGPNEVKECPVCKGAGIGKRTKEPCRRCGGKGYVGTGMDTKNHPWRRGQSASIAAHKSRMERREQ